MRSFEDVRELALGHHPDLDERLKEYYTPRSRDEIRAVPDDRWLAEMTKRVFQSGFVWKVIDVKWDGFEAAFDGFDPARVGFYSDEDVERLISDTRIVRNGQKIMATIENAQMIQDVVAEHGSFGTFLADWPVDDQIGLQDFLGKKGSRLGGMTGQYVLRFSGWDAFILSGDVVAALIREGVIDKTPTSKKAKAAVQDAFNHWRAESGQPQALISRTLAMSIG